MTGFVITPPSVPALAVAASDQVFPLRRVFCVGRNYAAHAAEMGAEVDREDVPASGGDEAALRQPDVSPLYADLTGLPPALFLAGEYDPLFEDSLLMATRWGEASEADLIRAPQVPHGFLHFGGPAARGARRAIRTWLDARLGD